MPPIANPSSIRTIAVLALGNLMHGDDGVGLHLLRALESQNRELISGMRSSRNRPAMD